MAILDLPCGALAEIDADDLLCVSAYHWYLVRRSGSKYVEAMISGKPQHLHRFLLRPSEGQVVDHINGDGLDNRRINLRICSQRENARNRGVDPRNKFGLKGVSFRSDSGKWRARITVNRRGIALGTFDSKSAAAAAYDSAARLHFGEFARLNANLGTAPQSERAA